MTALEFNTDLAKKLKQLKKDLGAVMVIQGYKGTGSRSYRRQVIIRFANGKAIDLWLESDKCTLGGVMYTGMGSVPYAGGSVDAVYASVVMLLTKFTAKE